MARPPRRQRRLRGTGSVSPRRDGRWEGRWLAPDDGSGQRPWVRVYASSESEADRLLDDAIRANRRGTRRADSRTTVAAYAETWLQDRADRLKPATYRSYEGALRVWIVPRIGRISLGRLDRRTVQRMLDGIERDHGTRAAGVAHAVLRKLLNDARRLDRIIEGNPASDATPPAWRRNTPTPWTVEQAAAFLDKLKGHRDEALYLLAAMVGPRPSETLGLRWSRVDLDRGRVKIDASLQWPVGGTPYLDVPKSVAGNRTIAIPPRVVAALRSHRVRQDAARIAAGDAWLDNGLVFATKLGRPIRPDTLSHQFSLLVAAFGFPHVRLYDLRRTAAALIIAAGDLEDARRILGHSSIRLAAETYGYGFEGQTAAVVAGVERLLGGILRTDTPSDTPSMVPERTA